MTTKKKLAKDQRKQQQAVQQAFQRMRQGPAMRPFSLPEIISVASEQHLRLPNIRDGVRLGLQLLYIPGRVADFAKVQVLQLLEIEARKAEATAPTAG